MVGTEEIYADIEIMLVFLINKKYKNSKKQQKTASNKYCLKV